MRSGWKRTQATPPTSKCQRRTRNRENWSGDRQVQMFRRVKNTVETNPHRRGRRREMAPTVMTGGDQGRRGRNQSPKRGRRKGALLEATVKGTVSQRRVKSQSRRRRSPLAHFHPCLTPPLRSVRNQKWRFRILKVRLRSGSSLCQVLHVSQLSWGWISCLGPDLLWFLLTSSYARLFL